MRAVDEGLSAVELDTGDEDLDVGGEGEGVALGAKPDGGAHDGVLGVDAQFLGGQAHGALEAGAVAHGEEGFGVGAVAGAAQFLGHAHDVADAERGDGGGAGATTGGVGGDGVCNLARCIHAPIPPLGLQSRKGFDRNTSFFALTSTRPGRAPLLTRGQAVKKSASGRPLSALATARRKRSFMGGSWSARKKAVSLFSPSAGLGSPLTHSAAKATSR